MHWQQKENPGGAVLTQLLEFLPFLSRICMDSKPGMKWMRSSLNASLGADGTPQLAAPSIHPTGGCPGKGWDCSAISRASKAMAHSSTTGFSAAAPQYWGTITAANWPIKPQE